MAHKNPLVLKERPLMGTLMEDPEEVQRTGHITFAQTADGKHIARMTQNGYPFEAIHDDRNKAMAALVQQVDTAQASGAILTPAHLKD